MNCKKESLTIPGLEALSPPPGAPDFPNDAEFAIYRTYPRALSYVKRHLNPRLKEHDIGGAAFWRRAAQLSPRSEYSIGIDHGAGPGQQSAILCERLPGGDLRIISELQEPAAEEHPLRRIDDKVSTKSFDLQVDPSLPSGASKFSTGNVGERGILTVSSKVLLEGIEEPLESGKVYNAVYDKKADLIRLSQRAIGEE